MESVLSRAYPEFHFRSSWTTHQKLSNSDQKKRSVPVRRDGAGPQDLKGVTPHAPRSLNMRQKYIPCCPSSMKTLSTDGSLSGQSSMAPILYYRSDGSGHLMSYVASRSDSSTRAPQYCSTCPQALRPMPRR